MAHGIGPIESSDPPHEFDDKCRTPVSLEDPIEEVLLHHSIDLRVPKARAAGDLLGLKPPPAKSKPATP